MLIARDVGKHYVGKTNYSINVGSKSNMKGTLM